MGPGTLVAVGNGLGMVGQKESEDPGGSLLATECVLARDTSLLPISLSRRPKQWGSLQLESLFFGHSVILEPKMKGRNTGVADSGSGSRCYHMLDIY